MRPVLLTDRVALLCGDSRALELGERTVDAVVCDPPYELGFMGKRWDATGIAYDVDLWRRVLRALKPGGHLLAFGGTRTYHRLACAIEDAGFEVRDSLHWLYGSGFPKSRNVSKDIDDGLGAERPVVGANPNHRAVSGMEYAGIYAGGNTGAAVLTAPATPEAQRWDGWGTALKPAHEPIILARRPLEGTIAGNVLAHGTGALNVDGCRIGDEVRWNHPVTGSDDDGAVYELGMRGRGEGTLAEGRWPANVVLSHDHACQQYPDQGNVWRCAPWCPVAELDRQSGQSRAGKTMKPRGRRPGGFGDVGADRGDSRPNGPQYGDAGGASRFFYCAKPSARERDFGCEALPVRTGGQLTDRSDGSAGLSSPRAGAGRQGGRRNYHPTVKPIELMRWLCRLVTPPGGVVLDPFCGSGTTGIAAVREGLAFVGVEQSDEYVEIARARITRALEEK